MRLVGLPWLVGTAVMMTCGVASATEEPDWLWVTASDSASDCPSAARLAELVMKEPGATATRTPSRYAVTFIHTPDGYTITIHVVGRDAGLRTVKDPGPTCEAAAHAVAVMLAILLDDERRAQEQAAEAAEQKPTTPAPPPPVPAPPPKPATSARPAPNHSKRDRAADKPAEPLALGVALAVGAQAGLLPRLSSGFEGELALGRGLWRVKLGALWLVPQTPQLPPGSARLEVVLGRLSGCVRLATGSWLTPLGCAALNAGSVSATASGYDVNGSSSRVWLGGSGALVLEAPRDSMLHGWAKGELLVPFRREGFDVRGAGSVFEPPALAFNLAIGAAFSR